MNTSAQSNSPVSTMSTMSLAVKQDLWWCTLSYNSESREEKMSEVKNIHTAKVFNTFLDHKIHMLGPKKKCRNSVKEFVS